MERKLKELLNDNLTLLSYEMEDLKNLQLQLVNDDMRLIVNINAKDKKASVTFATGEDFENEEFNLENATINY